MRLGNLCYELREKMENMLNLLTKQEFKSWDRVAGMSHEDLDGIKSIDEAYAALSAYVDRHTEMMEEMAQKLDSIQDELRSLNYHIEDMEKGQA